MQNKNQVLIYGRHAVAAALANPKRKIFKVYCLRETAAELQGKAIDNKLVIVDKKELEKMLPRDAVHQGMVAVAEILPSVAIEDVCAEAREQNYCHVLILDQVTDPQNIGAIIRSCAAFGSLALIVQDKNSPQESGAMLKAAAGTFELVQLCRITNLTRAVEKLKKEGFWAVGMDGYAKSDVSSLPKDGKLAVIMGSEGAGMRRLVEESCDLTVRLPINPKVESLNVSTAAAIVLYELSRK